MANEMNGAEAMIRMVCAAFCAMITGRPGAAHLGLPHDIKQGPVGSTDIWAAPPVQSFPACPQAPARR